MRTVPWGPSRNFWVDGGGVYIRRDQSRQFAAEVTKLTSREEAALAYSAYYLSKFTYPLPVTTFDTTQLKSIESPSIQALLPKLGYNRHFPRRVVFRPVEWGGLGLKSLTFIQGHQQTKLLLRVLNNDTKVTPLLQTLLRYSALESGTNALFGHDYKTVQRILHYLTPTWATSLLSFLSQHAIDINLQDGQFAPPLQ